MAKIAYIIYSLSNSAGMERSLTTRANFLSNIYDITIITQVSGTDFFKLDPKIHRIDLGIDTSLKKEISKMNVLGDYQMCCYL